MHQFYKEQPDLNLRNPKVIDELKEALQYWLDIGVDGFRIDSVGHFFEDEELNDEPQTGSGSEYQSLDHEYTYDRKEVLGVLKTFRELLDKKSMEDEEENSRYFSSQLTL